jgi:5-formyltetrahydrofolate cyclo-ligase
MPTSTIVAAKQAVRERVWDLLEAEHVVEPGVHGHIPNFTGAAAAAERLASLPAWKNARIIKAVPDTAQLPVRVRALADGKTVYMAVPKLADARPFYLVDPAAVALPPTEAATMRAAAAHAPRLAIDALQPIDLIVCGSVAVNRHGDRIGKGAGYSDLEVALLHDAGLLGRDTLIATTVHPLQLLDDELPACEHDFQVDLIVTPDEAISCRPSRQRIGIRWDDLPADYTRAIPVLATLSSPPSALDRAAPFTRRRAVQ